MTVHQRLGIVALLTILLGGATAAEARPQVDWDQPLNLSLAEANLGQVLKSFAKIGGATLVSEHPLDGGVTIDLNATPFGEALDQICRDHALRCEWHKDLARLSVFAAEDDGFRGLVTQIISIELQGASLQQTLQAMQAISDDNIEVDGEFDGTITLDVQGIPWTRALELLCADARCTVDWNADPIRITPRTQGADEVRVEIAEPVDPEARTDAEATPTLTVRSRAAAGEPTTATHAFDWANPVWRLAADDQRLHVAWLPFEPPMALTLHERCADEAWPTAAGPFAWPRDQSLQLVWSGDEIKALAASGEAPADDGEPSEAANRSARVPVSGATAEPCPRPSAEYHLVARVRESGSLRSETDLPPASGSYLAIEAAGSRPRAQWRADAGSNHRPQLAVVSLGYRSADNGIEEHRVLLVDRASGRPTLRIVSVEHGQPFIATYDDWSLELALIATADPSR